MQYLRHHNRFVSGRTFFVLLFGLLFGLLVAVRSATAAENTTAQDDGEAIASASPDVGVMQDNVVVLLDSSGSMKERMRRGPGSKMEVAKEALARVLDEIPDTTNVGLLVFGGKSSQKRWLYPLSPINRAELGKAILAPAPSGGTPLGRYMKVASDALLAQRRKQFGYGSYRLLIVTDGEAGDQALVERYTPDILSRGITVDVIGVDMASDHTLATRVHSYRKADDPDSLVRAVAEVFGEVALSGSDATNEEHFALIAGIPDDMALSMIQALARSGNHPIGERPATPGGSTNAGSTGRSQGSSGAHATPPRAPGSSTPVSSSPPSSSNNISFGLIVLIVIGVLVLLKVVIKVARSAGGIG